MKNIKTLLEKTGVEIPEILLPKDDINIEKWAVIACDQYTAEPEYWNDVENIVKDSPSTYKIMLPEIYLERDDIDKRHALIKRTMHEYAKSDMFKKFNGFIYIERELNDKSIRNGLIMALDLERYDFTEGSTSLIRATEGTIVDRLPPRVKIREKADLEMPHILVFIDDPDMEVIDSLGSKKDIMTKLYDFELMKGGNHIKGYGIDNKSLQCDILEKLLSLVDENYKEKYNLTYKEDRMLFAMGDGNHSFATAKVHWENIKKKNNLTSKDYHPARYALVEIVNIHNKGIVFKSIDRVVFDIHPDSFLNKAEEELRKNYNEVDKVTFPDLQTTMEFVNRSTATVHHIGFITEPGYGGFIIKKPTSLLAHATITTLLDSMNKNEELVIDYIHGEEIVDKLAKEKNNVGFLLPSIDKSTFFESVIKDGSLPRKTFSMGDANEKRYYLECRIIK